jgi:uncharacterized protein YbjT (DUF2867 family)
MTSQKVILVSGATGKQGGAAARALLKHGFKVRALVRDPGKVSAKNLEKEGADLVKGDLNDTESLKRALEGVEGAFSVQNFFEAGYEKEIEQGCRLADVAKESGVKHLVYSSVIGADRKSGIPHFESKWKIEEHIRHIGIQHTILRAVAYMDNWVTFNWFQDNSLYVPMRSDKIWQMIASKDIGEFAAIVISEPERFLGTALEIAGDEFTLPQAAKIFSKVLGHPVQYLEQPMSELRSFSEELALMFEWFNDKANFADLAVLRKINPELSKLESWIKDSSLVRDDREVSV